MLNPPLDTRDLEDFHSPAKVRRVGDPGIPVLEEMVSSEPGGTLPGDDPALVCTGLIF